MHKLANAAKIIDNTPKSVIEVYLPYWNIDVIYPKFMEVLKSEKLFKFAKFLLKYKLSYLSKFEILKIEDSNNFNVELNGNFNNDPFRQDMQREYGSIGHLIELKFTDLGFCLSVYENLYLNKIDIMLFGNSITSVIYESSLEMLELYIDIIYNSTKEFDNNNYIDTRNLIHKIFSNEENYNKIYDFIQKYSFNQPTIYRVFAPKKGERILNLFSFHIDYEDDSLYKVYCSDKENLVYQGIKPVDMPNHIINKYNDENKFDVIYCIERDLTIGFEINSITPFVYSLCDHIINAYIRVFDSLKSDTYDRMTSFTSHTYDNNNNISDFKTYEPGFYSYDSINMYMAINNKQNIFIVRKFLSNSLHWIVDVQPL